MHDTNSDFWKNKLMAFLHDPPCKCFDIGGHVERANSYIKTAGISLRNRLPEDSPETVKFLKETGLDLSELVSFIHFCDTIAASADRFPFPDHAKTKVRSVFDGSESNPFIHPLGDARWVPARPMPSVQLAEELFQVCIGGVPPEASWRDKFLLYWRRWPVESARKDERMAYVPADTRMPDHTIWTHMSLTSALQGCVTADQHLAPAFLLFQFGPVQEFIATARSTRDLLAGSYILGWLAAHALKAVADQCGPDAVVFPSLRGQPIFDALYREELYAKVMYDDASLWRRMGYTSAQLLSPTIPNRFLAVVPAANAQTIAETAAEALRAEWRNIATACWEGFAKLATQAGIAVEESWHTRWLGQTNDYWHITWQTWEWDRSTPKDENLAKLEKLACQTIPASDQVDNYYQGSGSSRCVKNIGFYWPAQFEQVSRLLAARRNTREFDQFFTDDAQSSARKDTLSGKEEVIGSERLWTALTAQSANGPFKGNEGPYGAIQIVKRLFMRDDPVPYLRGKLGLKKLDIRFDSVEDVAKKNDDHSPYVAVIALDGDSMGKRISGELTPHFIEQLSPEACKYFESLPGFDPAVRRPLSPSYHLQFSEALANFATRLAEQTVALFDGQLIYAGGDDVLAMVPADKALACAIALRACFRGESPAILKDDPDLAHRFQKFSEAISFPTPGWVKPGNGKEDYPLMVPGPATDLSCGIAIAHQNHPLQSMVRAAHDAEKRAKQELGRAACAVSLLKRGGETVHWGCKWEHHAMDLYHRFLSWRRAGTVTGRFAYALAEMLKPYALDNHRHYAANLDIRQLITRELETPLERQCFDREIRTELRALCVAYLGELGNGYFDNGARKDYNATHDGEDPPPPWADFAKLFLTAAFIDRDRKED